MSAVEKAVPVELPVIGQAYGGGFVTGITRDPVTGNRYLSITAGAEHELTGAWGDYGAKIEGADSFTNSRANTEAIPARDVQELQYRHFKPTTEQNWAGRRDGDNPHSEPVGLLYSEEDPKQTAHEAFQASGPEAFRDTWYWSSSQRSAYDAFRMHFDGGCQDGNDKDGELRVRPVRSELI